MNRLPPGCFNVHEIKIFHRNRYVCNFQLWRRVFLLIGCKRSTDLKLEQEAKHLTNVNVLLTFVSVTQVIHVEQTGSTDKLHVRKVLN